MHGRRQVRIAKPKLTDPFGWIGSTLDTQFAVEAVAGQGGFGIVYRGLHLGLDVPVAIKCLKLPTRLGETDRRGFLTRLRKEARLLHHLSRQTVSIVQALHVGAATAPSGVWTPYLVMEWLDGRTLEDDLCARRASGKAPRCLDEAIRLLAPTAMALSIAHEENVAHLDLKPANLIFTKIRTGPLLKVLDFGVAKTFVNTPGMTLSITQPSRGMQAFTPQYGAPEQFSPQYGVPGPWTDVFAMALLLIEVASGHHALEGANADQLYFAATDERNRSQMISRIPGVSDPVGAVLLRALHVNAQYRFRTLGEMWTALNEARGEVSDIRLRPMPMNDMEVYGSEGGSSDEDPVRDMTTQDPPVERAWEESRRPYDTGHDAVEEPMVGPHDTSLDAAEQRMGGSQGLDDDSGEKTASDALNCATGQEADVKQISSSQGMPCREVLARNTEERTKSKLRQDFSFRVGGIRVRWLIVLSLGLAVSAVMLHSSQWQRTEAPTTILEHNTPSSTMSIDPSLIAAQATSVPQALLPQTSSMALPTQPARSLPRVQDEPPKGDGSRTSKARTGPALTPPPTPKGKPYDSPVAQPSKVQTSVVPPTSKCPPDCPGVL